MSEFSINNPNGYQSGGSSFRVYGADGRLKSIGAGGGGGATWGTITGDILNQTDLINYISSQTGSGFVPESRTITINGVTQDLTANQVWSLPTGGTVTDVTGTGSVKGLTLTGTGTGSVTLTLGGSLVLVASDITTALQNTYDDIYVTGNVTGLNTTATHLIGAINELEQDLFNAEGGTKRTRSSLLTSDKTSIATAVINKG